MNSKSKRSYDDFYAGIALFSVGYIISMIYNYAKDYIIFRANCKSITLVLMLCEIVLLMVPFIAFLIIGISNNKPLTSALDIIASFNIVYIVMPAINYFSGFLNKEDYWVGSVILKTGILTIDISLFRIIIGTTLYTCTGIVAICLFTESKTKFKILTIVSAIFISILHFFNVIDDFARIAIYPLCIYAQANQALIEASQLPVDKINNITWTNWFARFIIPIILGSITALLLNAIFYTLKEEAKHKLKK